MAAIVPHGLVVLVASPARRCNSTTNSSWTGAWGTLEGIRGPFR